MEKITGSQKYLFVVSALTIAIFSALGFYLIDGEPKIKSLVVTGHNHILSFAYGALLFAFVLSTLSVPETRKKLLSIWMSLTFLGPLSLMYAGFTARTGLLEITGPLFEGSFVLVWLIVAFLVLSEKRER